MIGKKQAAIFCVAVTGGATALNTQHQASSSRRAFLSRVPLVAAGTGAAFLINLDGNHDSNCGCISCANAYERRDVGGADRSAVTAAMNEQAFRTNNRLEQSGFKLDTREEEQERLSSALASFSYDSSSSTSGSKKTGYSSKSSSSQPASSKK